MPVAQDIYSHAHPFYVVVLSVDGQMQFRQHDNVEEVDDNCLVHPELSSSIPCAKTGIVHAHNLLLLGFRKFSSSHHFINVQPCIKTLLLGACITR